MLFTLSVHISKSINLPKNVAPTNNIKRIGSSVVTQVCFLRNVFFYFKKCIIFQTQFFDVLSSSKVFYVPSSERKYENDKFGEGESLRTCQQIMKETSAHIEISSGKDQSLTFLVTGKANEVLEVRRKIYRVTIIVGF